MLDILELAEIEGRVTALPAGAWFVGRDPDHTYWVQRVVNYERIAKIYAHDGADKAASVAEFIAASRTDVPRLVEEVCRLNRIVEEDEITIAAIHQQRDDWQKCWEEEAAERAQLAGRVERDNQRIIQLLEESLELRRQLMEAKA
jgi:hypothetical protein